MPGTKDALFWLKSAELVSALYRHKIKSKETRYVTGFEKTDHIVTINISRNTDLKY